MSSNSSSGTKNPVYLRLISGLSFFDLISSTVNLGSYFFWGPTYGGDPKCTALVFFQLSSTGSAVAYNAGLGIYFLLVIVFEAKDRTLTRYFEPFAHFVSIVIIWSFGIAGIFAEVYNPQLEGVCWVTPYPASCHDESDCERGGQWGWTMHWIASGTFLLSLFILLVTNTIVFAKVRSLERKNRRFWTRSMSQRANINLSNNSSAHGGGGGGGGGGANNSHTRRVAMQSFLFCAGIIVVFAPAFIRDFLPGNGTLSPSDSAMALLSDICWPLQGFFDSIVYFRPRYMNWRRHCSNESRWYAVKMSVFTTLKPASPRRHCNFLSSSAKKAPMEDSETGGSPAEDSATASNHEREFKKEESCCDVEDTMHMEAAIYASKDFSTLDLSTDGAANQLGVNGCADRGEV